MVITVVVCTDIAGIAQISLVRSTVSEYFDQLARKSTPLLANVKMATVGIALPYDVQSIAEQFPMPLHFPLLGAASAIPATYGTRAPSAA